MVFTRKKKRGVAKKIVEEKIASANEGNEQETVNDADENEHEKESQSSQNDLNEEDKLIKEDSTKSDVDKSQKGKNSKKSSTPSPSKIHENDESDLLDEILLCNDPKDSQKIKNSKKSPKTSKRKNRTSILVTSESEKEKDEDERDESSEKESINNDVQLSETELILNTPKKCDINDKNTENDEKIVDEIKSNDKEEEKSKPLGIRLVPLNLLLRQDVLNNQDSKSTSKSLSRRTRNKKNASYIEISSGEDESSDEQISISSQSDDNSNDDDRSLHSKRKSTNKKLINGIDDLFKEPVSPTKYAKKSFTLNLEKMPDNVNKLMKNYRVNDYSAVSTDLWPETDDFENMIETSKIDRTALDKEKSEKEIVDSSSKKSCKNLKSRSRVVITSDSDTNSSDINPISKKKEKNTMPARSRSTRTAVQNRRQIIENDTSESSEDDVPLSKNKAVSTVNNKIKTASTAASVSDSDQNKSSSKNSDISENDEKKNRSKTNDKDKLSKSNSNASSSSEKKSISPKGKSSNLKITINLNENKVINHSKDKEDSSNSDTNNDKNGSELSESESDDEPIIKNIKKASKKLEENVNDSDDEIPDDEKAEIRDQKLRNRNKFEVNRNFEKLKEKVQERKKKTKPTKSEEESTTTKNSDVSNDKGKENHSENSGKSSQEENKSNTKLNKRKRLISSSEEESENSKTKDKQNNSKRPAKRRKKKMDDDSEYENTHSESEEGADQNDKSSSEDEIRKRKRSSSNEDDDDDDDDNDDEDLDDLEKGRAKGKRRKRIKKIESSDEDGSGDEKSKKNSGRKAIRKIIRNDKLDVSTKEAAKIERERKQRIEERQKLYNQVYDESPEEIKEITSLVLDFDEETKESLLEVDKKLVKKLKPHQANGVKFMWDACFESLERCENENGSGCILAHCMGLGKTLQVITLVHTLMVNGDKTGVSRVLVVCPLNTVLNWVNEFHKWLRGIKGSEDVEVYEINKLKQNVDRANKLMEWHNEGGVMILSYDMFRNLSNDTGNRLRKKVKESLQTSLLDPGPDLVICDEGHLLKNEKTSISKAMNKLRTLRRIVLTGTPLQNNLKEYYCMVQFVKPNLLGKYQEYMNRFVNPITNGQYTDSTDYDIQVMRRRAHVLHKLLDGCVQRRDYSVLAPFLPPKHEYIVSIKLTPMQANLYKFYMENKARQGDEGGRKGSILFQDFQNLQRIWSAPKALRYNSDRYEVEMQRRKDLESEEEESVGSIKDFLDDSESAASTSSEETDEDLDEEVSDAQSINSNDVKKKKKKKDKMGETLPRRTRATFAALPEELRQEEEAPQKIENPTEWWMQICPEEELNNIEHSSKLLVLMSILEKCEAIGDKLLVFSQSLYSLDVIEHFLNYIDDQTQNNVENASFTASWTLGLDYFRLDGSTPVEQRNQACKLFNSPDNPRARLFLISTRAGGLGINLVAANRVVIFDVSWNPSHDVQSIFRVYRFGQTKPCYIYRFLAYGTMEEKIYERQVTKQAISKRVIDEQQIDRHYNQNDLQELYKYDLEPDDDIREVPILPKDRLFAEILKKYEDMIYKYHEHDTLLENKEEETLDEEERKAAWEEFEAEKNRPQYVSYNYNMQPQQQRTGPVTSNNIFGIRTDVLLKLLSMKARLDNPTMNEANVKHAIPILMQELYRQMDRGELTLYQQLLALSSSLEVPSNYGGQFQVNESLMHQTYNNMNMAMPSTSAASSSLLLRQQLIDRQKNLSSQLQRQAQMRARSPPRVISGVIEID